MGDVKDILGLSRDSAGAEALPAKKDKVKELKTRPKGMSRETFNLLHGTHHLQQGEILREIEKDRQPAPASFTKVRVRRQVAAHAYLRIFAHAHTLAQTDWPAGTFALAGQQASEWFQVVSG